MKNEKTNSRIALVTGGNKGIGLETVRQLAAREVHVLLAARYAQAGQAAADALRAEALAVDFLPLDVTNAESIRAAAAAVETAYGRLDILINNAGIFIDDSALPVSGQALATWRQTFDTNLFGLIAVTQAFLPLLRRSQAGRIVNLTSILGSNTLHSDPTSFIFHSKRPAYNVSKSAVNAWTVHLAYELRDTPIKVNAAHPGWVKTDMGGADAHLEVVDGARTSVDLALLPADGPSGTYSHLGQTLPW